MEKTKEWEPRIIAFLCNWCSYAGADLAGVSRTSLPPNILNIRVMCSGRVNPVWILNAYLKGADGILVAGCHPRDCHYQRGNLFTRRRYVLLKDIFQTLGWDDERIKVSWISASEGIRYSEVVKEFTELVKEKGPNPAKSQMFL
jgi:F420-non-reducing hydrogenase iron-sulfur subunit